VMMLNIRLKMVLLVALTTVAAVSGGGFFDGLFKF
jgi:ABC-type proline/glycine betaine transport system permease subunit